MEKYSLNQQKNDEKECLDLLIGLRNEDKLYISQKSKCRVIVFSRKIDLSYDILMYVSQRSIIDMATNTKLTCPIFGLHCAACAARAREVLMALEGVAEASVNLADASVSIHYDPSRIAPEQMQQAIAEAGYELVLERNAKISCSIFGLHCAACAARAREVLMGLEGVAEASVNLADATASIVYSPSRVSPAQMQQAIAEAGYELVIGQEEDLIEERQAEEYRALRRKTWQALAVAAYVMVDSMVGLLGGLSPYLVALATTFVVFFPGRMFYQRAYRQITSGGMGMDTLVAISTGIAYLYSLFNLFFSEVLRSMGVEPHLYFEASTMIIGFVLLGKYLESRAKHNTTAAIKGLMELRPREAVRLLPSGEQEVCSIDALRLGDLVLVRPGEGISVDGIIVQGASSIDESMLTGESIPVDKGEGDYTYAGTINQQGLLTIKMTSLQADTVLSRIIDRVREAQGSRAPIQLLVDRIASKFVLGIIILALLTFGLWMWLAPTDAFAMALIASITVLIIACPCALGLATPTAVMAGIGRAARQGILIKDAESLERAQVIDTLVLDKTGTITEGRPEVRSAHWLVPRTTELAHLLRSLESPSQHPLSVATVAYLHDAPEQALPVEAWTYISGRGIQASWQGCTYWVGNLALIQEQGVELTGEAEALARELYEGQQTVVYFAREGELLAILGIADRVKPHVRRAIEALERRGIEVWMLTGDHEAIAQSIAHEVGIAHLQAGISPESKADFVLSLQAQGRKVAMVGDGINDSAALATADVSVAMGQGTDIAIGAAMVTIVSGDLRRLDNLIEISERSVRTIRQNLFWAFAYNVIAIPIAAGALYPFTGFMMTPMLASLAMTFSSVSVVLNSLRLARGGQQ